MEKLEVLKRIAPMSARVVVSPKINNDGYKKGVQLTVCIDHLWNDKVCVYHYNGNSVKAARSYMVYKNLEEMHNDFDFIEIVYNNIGNKTIYEKI